MLGAPTSARIKCACGIMSSVVILMPGDQSSSSGSAGRVESARKRKLSRGLTRDLRARENDNNNNNKAMFIRGAFLQSLGQTCRMPTRWATFVFA